jgi:hypothetical protein
MTSTQIQKPTLVRTPRPSGASCQDTQAALHPAGAAAVANLLEATERHLRNVRLGAGHQSPDYQWWQGQPALDGDLIRLRGAVAQALREGAAAQQDRGEAGPDQPIPAGKPREP